MMVSNGSGSRRRRAGGLAGAMVLAGLLLVATACGGGSSSSGSSGNGSSNGASNGLSNALSNGASASCLELASKFGMALASATASTGSNSQDWDATIKSFDAATSSIPSSIRDDWKTYVDALKSLSAALAGLDLSKMMSDPTVMKKYTDALKKLDDAKVKTAMTNIENYFKKECPN